MVFDQSALFLPSFESALKHSKMSSYKVNALFSEEELKVAQTLVDFARSIQQSFSKPFLFQKEEHRKEDIEDSEVEESSEFEDESVDVFLDVDEDEYQEKVDEEKKTKKTTKKRKQSRNPNACAAHKRKHQKCDVTCPGRLQQVL